MDDRANPYRDVIGDGIELRIDRRIRVAALRYFDRGGGFAKQCQSAFGVALPDSQQALEVSGALLGQECLLAWRSPTQTLVLVSDDAAFSALQAALPSAPDGCCIDQSGGVWVLRISGPRTRDLLLRIGNNASTPQPGEAHVGRIAELTVLAISVKAGETLLVIDRGFAEHLLDWARVTVADFSLLSCNSHIHQASL